MVNSGASTVGRIEKWIRSEFTNQTRVDKVTTFGLIHYQGSTPQEVRTIKLGSKEWDSKELATIIHDAAKDFGEGIEGRQQFEIVSFYEETENVPQSRFTFAVHGINESQQQLNGIGTETPNAEGMARQNMRHSEGWMGFVLQMTSQTMVAQTQMMRMQQEEVQHLRREAFDTIELARELLLQHATEAHEQEMTQRRFDRESNERMSLIKLLPSAANRLLGKDIFPTNTEDTSIIESIANDLDADELEAMMMLLSAKVKNKLVIGLMAERITKIIEEKRRTAPSRKAPPPQQQKVEIVEESEETNVNGAAHDDA